MATTHGYNCAINWGGTVLSTFNNEWNLELGRTLHDVTTFGTQAETFAAGLASGQKFTCKGLFDGATLDAAVGADVLAGTSRTLTVSTAGVAESAANPEWSGTAFIDNYKVNAKVNDMVMADLSFQFSGAVTRDVT